MKKNMRKKKRSSSQKFWVIVISIILFLFILVSLFSPTASDVKGASTSQQQGGFLSSVTSTFSSLFKSKNKEKTLAPTGAPEQTTESGLTTLPLGDNKYVTSPKIGYIYSCQTSFTGSGAFTAGPWINQSAGTWDLTKKAEVDGTVLWPSSNVTFTLNGTARVISGNGLPNHATGVYPIASSDDAYTYDRNPNSIKSGTISLTLPANPTVLTTPECVGGSVGIMLSGTPLYNGFDAGGRDAVAWEVQDSCDGHPQSAGQYHYHGPSSCVTDTALSDGHSGLLGYALDGFGIFGIKGEGGKQVWTADLDECHGHTHSITWDGSIKSIYHYHMTYDFPYSVGCFRGKKAAKTVGAVEGQGGAVMKSQRPSRMPNQRPQGRPSFSVQQ